MTLTPATLTRHELTGLPVRVADAANPDAVGIAGRVVSETTNTVVVGPATLFPAAGSASPDNSDDAGAATAAQTAAGSESGSFDAAATEGDAGRESDAERDPNAGRESDAERNPNAGPERGADDERTADGSAQDERQRRESSDEGRDRRVPKRGTTFEFAVPTDEAASRRLLGSAFELPWETVGTGSTRPADKSGGCEGVGYVTVDGARLVARPARRTERAGDTLWQLD